MKPPAKSGRPPRKTAPKAPGKATRATRPTRADAVERAAADVGGDELLPFPPPEPERVTAPIPVPASAAAPSAPVPRGATFGAGISGAGISGAGVVGAGIVGESARAAPPPPAAPPVGPPASARVDEEPRPAARVPHSVPPPAIPPLPEEDEDFEPIPVEEEMPEASREAPEGATPAEILESVRGGTLHVAAFSRVPDEALRDLAASIGLAPRPSENRSALIYRLLHERPPPPPPPVETSYVEGLLEVLPDGYGFLRSPEHGYVAMPTDVYVPPALVRRVGLLPGHWVSGTARSARPGERYGALIEVEEVNHEDPSVLARRVPFEEMTATHPDERFILETRAEEVSMRIMDLFCPLGRGQRALIVSPPRAGKTVILQQIADSLARNSPTVDIVVLLVDERPEEVTNMRRSVRGEVFASTFDQPAHRHIHLAELVMEKVKRMVEFGRHVVLLLDSLTRLGRAYNNESGGTGRLLTGGMEANALTKPKRFFGSARNIEHGGSLTILATALTETGSRLDEVIFEEFKGTGNMELVLSRELANMRIWPAIDVPRSGTRREELLFHPDEQKRITALRRAMTGMSAPEAIEDLLERMKKHRTNAEFLMNVEV